MEIVAYNSAKQFPLEDEGINAFFLPSSEFYSAGLGEVPVCGEQRKHIHQRPQKGDEIMFIFEGKFELMTDGSSQEFDVTEQGPIYITVKNGETAILKNKGKTPVKFFSVFTPPWTEGEMKWME